MLRLPALGGPTPRGFKATAFWGSVVAVVTLSLTPVAHLPPQVFDVWDKAQHALGFARLTVLGLWAYPARPWALVAALLWLGAGIEWAQEATGWRHGDAWDWLADAVGIAVAAGIHRAVRRPSAPAAARRRTP